MKTNDLAYVLHRRPFKDTSLLVDFFTQQHGIITAVCRGARQNKKKQPLTSFNLFWIEYDHRHQLATLYQYEPESNTKNNSENSINLANNDLVNNAPINLVGNQLYCGLYLNELLIKLLGRDDPYSELFAVYQKTLNQLQLPNFVSNPTHSDTQHIEKSLRLFELYLLEEIGYGISLEKTSDTHQLINENNGYYYNPQVGFSLTHADTQSPFIFSGKTLIKIAQKDFSDTQTLKDAKRLMRLTLNVLLERHGKLKSRELFVK